jgi:hypothetical protein
MKQPLWLVPLIIALVVAVFGWWGNYRLRETIETQLKDQLNATLDANVTALQIWTTNQVKFATLMAEEPGVRTASLHILDNPEVTGPELRGPGPELRGPGTDAGKFANYLRPRLIQMGYEIAQLVDTNFMVAASSDRVRLVVGAPIYYAHTNKFAELFASDEPVMITPFISDPILERHVLAQGNSPAGTNAALRRMRRVNALAAGRGRRGDLTLMQVAAPVHDTNGVVRGALALVINPDREFSRILSVARSGESGETYAFDQTGLLISHSRFDAQLHQLGLLNATNTSSALYVRLHDPGGDLTQGYQPAEAEPGSRPLIRIVADAVEGTDGVDVTPSRDYRGVPVVGAWRWLPQLGFGVATQIDADEAFRPLHIVRLLFIMLLLLLILCAVGMLLFSFANVAFRRRLNVAELKLKQLGQYTLEEKIGEGGMGVVYRARHALMRRDTAVKLLLPDRADPAAIVRFEREVCLTCQLTHPNTIQVYDYGHTPEGIFYYVMEYLRGLNLHDFVDRFGPMPEARVIHILTQVCESLAEAHGLGLIHRDIKPGNIFLCDRGGIPDCVKVLDFGLVQEYRGENRQQMNLVGRDAVEGTPWFMPPEAIEDAAASDPRSDIYSMGALAYYLLTGAYAYDGATVREIHTKQLAGPPPPPSQLTRLPISPELDSIIMACLAAAPADRPQSVLDLRALLRATPHAADWTLRDQAEWWAQFHRQPEVKYPDTKESAATPMATVKIDINTRLK